MKLPPCCWWIYILKNCTKTFLENWKQAINSLFKLLTSQQYNEKCLAIFCGISNKHSKLLFKNFFAYDFSLTFYHKFKNFISAHKFCIPMVMAWFIVFVDLFVCSIWVISRRSEETAFSCIFLKNCIYFWHGISFLFSFLIVVV